MSKDKEKIIDLASYSISALGDGPPSTRANKHTCVAPEPVSESDLSVPELRIDQLASYFYTREGLRRHLMSLDPATLSEMLLSQVHDHQLRPKPQIPKSAAKPRVQEGSFAHCIYCHRVYDKDQNLGCRVRHFGRPGVNLSLGRERAWTCCARPFRLKLYCYEGMHWAEEIEYDDGLEGLWWEKWWKSGKTCADLGCDEGYDVVCEESEEEMD